MTHTQPLLALGVILIGGAAHGAPKQLYKFSGANESAAAAGPLVELGGLLYGVARGYEPNDTGSGIVYSFNPTSRLEGVMYFLAAAV